MSKNEGSSEGVETVRVIKCLWTCFRAHHPKLCQACEAVSTAHVWKAACKDCFPCACFLAKRVFVLVCMCVPYLRVCVWERETAVCGCRQAAEHRWVMAQFGRAQHQRGWLLQGLQPALLWHNYCLTHTHTHAHTHTHTKADSERWKGKRKINAKRLERNSSV